MGTDKIIMYVVAFILGMLMYHMLKGVCGCKTVEARHHIREGNYVWDVLKNDYDLVTTAGPDGFNHYTGDGGDGGGPGGTGQV